MVANGIVQVAGENKTIQHLEGGIVKELHVREGDTVNVGDLLLVLEDTKPRAEQYLLEARYFGALAEIGRLDAELYGREDVVFSDEFADLGGDSRIDEIKQSQIDLFKERRAQHAGEIEILNTRVDQLGKQVNGLIARRDAAEQEQELLENTVATLADLAERRIESDIELTQRRLDLAKTRGSVGQISAEIAEAQLAIGETQQQIIQLKNNYRTEISDNLTKAQKQPFRGRRPPVRGARPGGPHPHHGADQGQGHQHADPHRWRHGNRRPAVDEHRAGGRPADCGSPGASHPTATNVNEGQEARLRLTALKQRATPVLMGIVTLVSADILTDEQTQMQYYLAQIDIPDDELGKLGDKDMRPGFPVEVTFTGSEGTMLAYIADPLSGLIRRAMIEE